MNKIIGNFSLRSKVGNAQKPFLIDEHITDYIIIETDNGIIALLYSINEEGNIHRAGIMYPEAILKRIKSIDNENADLDLTLVKGEITDNIIKKLESAILIQNI